MDTTSQQQEIVPCDRGDGSPALKGTTRCGMHTSPEEWRARKTRKVPPAGEVDALAATVRAALNANERTARGASCDDPGCRCGSWQNDDMPGEIRDDRNAGTIAHVHQPRIEAHIRRHDPRRVREQTQALRALLDDLLAAEHGEGRDGRPCMAGFEGLPCNYGRDERLSRRLRMLAHACRTEEDA